LAIFFLRLRAFAFNLLKINQNFYFKNIGIYFAASDWRTRFNASNLSKKGFSRDKAVIHGPARLGIDSFDLRSVVGGQRIDDRLTYLYY